MKKINTTMGAKLCNDNGQSFGFIGEPTEFGYCYKDLDAWNNGNEDDIIYISEAEFEDFDIDNNNCFTKQSWLSWVREECEREGLPYDEEFVEYIAFSILQECDWQDLSTMLNETDLIENFNEFMSKKSN